MQYKQLGKTSQQISQFGLGTMYFGTKVDAGLSYKLLDIYEDYGGSFLDSANKYASWIEGARGGESETIIGNWMKEKKNRNKFLVSSKVGFAYGDVPQSLKSDIIVSECERSLKRLGTDCIDIYFAHTDDRSIAQEEYMEAFFQLKKDGKIRFAGASNFNSWRLSQANSIANNNGWDGFSCIQQRHTLLESSLRANTGTQVILTPEMTDYCESNNVTIMAYSPLLAGVYSKAGAETPLHYRNKNSERKLLVLNQISEELHVSPNAVVLAWMAQGNPSMVPLVTGSSELQLKENFEAIDVKLTEKHINKLNEDVLTPQVYS